MTMSGKLSAGWTGSRRNLPHLRDSKSERSTSEHCKVTRSRSFPGLWVPCGRNTRASRYPCSKQRIRRFVIGSFRRGRSGILTASCQDLETIPLITDRMFGIVPEDHPLGGQKALSLDQLVSEPIIRSLGSCGMIVASGFSKAGLSCCNPCLLPPKSLPISPANGWRDGFMV